MSQNKTLPQAPAAPTGRQQGRSFSLSNLLHYVRRRLGATILVALILIFILTALIPGILAPYDPQKIDADVALQAPAGAHWLGTDHLGRDILSRLIHGTRVVMLVGLGGMGIAMSLGVLLGLLSGYYGGWTESIIMRFTDAILAFPTMLLAIIFVATFGASAFNVVIVIGLGYLPRFTRLVRASVLVLKQTDFVLASRAIGASDYRVLTRHILPNAFVPIITQATLGIGFAFLIEAAMSYLGFGVQPPAPSWGAMLNKAQQYLYVAPWFVLAPGITISIAVLVFNLAGDRLRERADPRLRKL